MAVSHTRSFHIPRHMDASWPSVVCLAGGLAYIVGMVAHPALPIWWSGLSMAATLGASALVLQRTWTHRGHLSLAWELEAAGSIVLAAFVLSRGALALGGQELMGFVWAALVLVAALAHRRTTWAAVVFALVLHLGSALFMALVQAQAPVWATVAAQSMFMVIFGALAYVVHGVDMHQRRHIHREHVEAEREHMLLEAREFRLLHSAGGHEHTTPKDDDLVMRDAVEAVHHTVYVSLGLLKTALKCHTCVLLWYDLKQEHLTIKELVSDADGVTEGDIDPGRGAIGGITRRREPVSLKDLRPGYRGLPYYRDVQPVKHFLGVPVIEQGHLRGVLCVDRMHDEAFGANEVQVLEDTASYILRAVQNERIFAAVEKSKNELGRFFDASKRLNSVLTSEDVCREALKAMSDIAPFEFAALTLYDPETQEHTIARAEVDPKVSNPQDVSAWLGRSFPENQGLVSMVVKNQHYLPYAGLVREQSPLVFTPRETLPHVQSLMVLPLIVHEESIGTLIVGHSERGQYSQERREMMEVVSHQVAISLQHANLYARMETMATRDPLTGLSNRRDFLGKLNAAVARHKRTGRTFGLVLTDIDKFKSVNDTYGHSVGDEVLRQVSDVFHTSLRETDQPARYGGEEFIILLEETDLEGSRVIADRLREHIGGLVFDSDQGPFSRTISMGVAMWPADHENLDQLIEYADQALYHSKTHGRNKVSVWSEVIDV